MPQVQTDKSRSFVGVFLSPLPSNAYCSSHGSPGRKGWAARKSTWAVYSPLLALKECHWLAFSTSKIRALSLNDNKYWWSIGDCLWQGSIKIPHAWMVEWRSSMVRRRRTLRRTWTKVDRICPKWTKRLSWTTKDTGSPRKLYARGYCLNPASAYLEKSLLMMLRKAYTHTCGQGNKRRLSPWISGITRLQQYNSMIFPDTQFIVVWKGTMLGFHICDIPKGVPQAQWPGPDHCFVKVTRTWKAPSINYTRLRVRHSLLYQQTYKRLA